MENQILPRLTTNQYNNFTSAMIDAYVSKFTEELSAGTLNSWVDQQSIINIFKICLTGSYTPNVATLNSLLGALGAVFDQLSPIQLVTVSNCLSVGRLPQNDVFAGLVNQFALQKHRSRPAQISTFHCQLVTHALSLGMAEQPHFTKLISAEFNNEVHNKAATEETEEAASLSFAAAMTGERLKSSDTRHLATLVYNVQASQLDKKDPEFKDMIDRIVTHWNDNELA